MKIKVPARKAAEANPTRRPSVKQSFMKVWSKLSIPFTFYTFYSFKRASARQRTPVHSVEDQGVQTLEIMKKPLSTGTLLARYRNPLKLGSLGGLTRFAKNNNILVKRTREVLERDLGYTLR